MRSEEKGDAKCQERSGIDPAKRGPAMRKRAVRPQDWAVTGAGSPRNEGFLREGTHCG